MGGRDTPCQRPEHPSTPAQAWLLASLVLARLVAPVQESRTEGSWNYARTSLIIVSFIPNAHIYMVGHVHILHVFRISRALEQAKFDNRRRIDGSSVGMSYTNTVNIVHSAIRGIFSPYTLLLVHTLALSLAAATPGCDTASDFHR